jgi:hypothetical protein
MNRSDRLGVAVAWMGLAVAAAAAADFYVDSGNTSGTETGTQQSPFRRVQAAIDAAASGDTIRVAAGTYTENLRIEAKALVVQGGYSSGWIRDIGANLTTLTGAGGNAVINLIEADATIDGFRIRGGTGSTEELPYGYHGGGIYSRGGSPTISNNVIENNDVRSEDAPSETNFGGGVHVSDAASANILNNIVRGNFAGRGAGLSVVSVQAALIQGNTIEDNTSVGDHGGGLYVAVVNARITQNIIRRNEVGRALGYGWGGGLIVFNPGNYAEISFNRVYENFAAGYGAGEFIDEGARADIHHELIYRNLSKDGCEAVSAIAVDGGDGVGSQATITHCTVVGNACETAIRGNGLQVEGMSSASVTNSIFWNNGGDDFAVDATSTLSVTYTCSEEAIAGTGNISADPRFVGAAADNYRLAAGSPCIDAGDPASSFDQEAAPNGGRADMGRYGNATDVPVPGGPGDDGADDATETNPGGNAGDDGVDDAPETNPGGNTIPEMDPSSAPVTDAGGDASGAVSSSAACPTASALLLSIPLLGARRRHRQSLTAGRRTPPGHYGF